MKVKLILEGMLNCFCRTGIFQIPKTFVVGADIYSRSHYTTYMWINGSYFFFLPEQDRRELSTSLIPIGTFPTFFPPIIRPFVFSRFHGPGRDLGEISSRGTIGSLPPPAQSAAKARQNGRVFVSWKGKICDSSSLGIKKEHFGPFLNSKKGPANPRNTATDWFGQIAWVSRVSWVSWVLKSLDKFKVYRNETLSKISMYLTTLDGPSEICSA